jgi:hypothetical protein
MIPEKPKPKTPTEFELETEERIRYMRERQMMIDRARNNIQERIKQTMLEEKRRRLTFQNAD